MDSTMHTKTPFRIRVIGEEIAGYTVKNANSSGNGSFVFLHGGGPTSFKERVGDVQDVILKKGLPIVTFDFNGHGESSGVLSQGSLKKRFTIARAIIDNFCDNKSLTLCGVSMGGYVALKLLPFYSVEKLILISPALYDRKAYEIPFNEGFTEIIRQPLSWLNTDVLDTLESFTGKLLIIIGEKDELIPPGVIDLIMTHSVHATRKELYTVPSCPHKIQSWFESNPQELKEMQQKLSDFL